MQVILGSGGAIGKPLAEALATYTDKVRCCSRKAHELPQATSTTYEHYTLDATDAKAVEEAVQGAEVVYVCVGLKYDLNVWKRDWPSMIDGIISACAKTGSRLAFFDNVYAYAKTSYGNMTEESPIDPPSKKGRVRAEVLNKLWAAHKQGKCEVTVARAADFYGPNVKTSLLGFMVFDKLKSGSSAQWLGDTDVPHSFTYTLDAGKHFALLANDDRAYGEVWHLPTAPNPWTIKEWVSETARILGKKEKLQRIPSFLFWLLSKFNTDLRELYDVKDQIAGPYVFNSNKFEEAFGVTATEYEEGVDRSLYLPLCQDTLQ